MTTIASAAWEALRGWGDHPCLVEFASDGTPVAVSAATLQARIAEQSSRLARWGVRRGVLVAIFLENSSDFIVCVLALARLHAVPVFGKLEYRSMELGEYFGNSNAQFVIAETHHLAVLAPHLRGRTVVARSETGLRLVQNAETPPAGADLPDDAASINYTYRGYGYPLGAILTHRQYLHGARVLQQGLQAGYAERMLYSIPMSHIFTLVGCILVPLLNGITGVIARTIHPRLLFEIINELNVQHVTAVPELYALLRRARGDSVQLPSLEVFVSGGSLLTAEEYHLLLEAFGVEVLHGYGLTEFTPVSRNSRGEGRPATVGPVCSGVNCRIGAEADETDGEILVGGPYVSSGYYKRDDETREAWCGEWFRTGDIGRFDGEHLVFLQEEKRTCKVNGVMVDLAEIERAIRLDRDVAEVAVTVESGGITARIEPARRLDLEAKPREIREFLKGQLAVYKVPRTINITT